MILMQSLQLQTEQKKQTKTKQDIKELDSNLKVVIHEVERDRISVLLNLL